MKISTRASSVVLVLGAWFAFAATASAEPDPLGERRKPTLQQAPEPAPPARPSSGQTEEGAEADGPDGPQAKTAVVSTARSSEQPDRTEATATEGNPGGSARDARDASGGGKAVGTADGGYVLGPRDVLRIEIWNRSGVEHEWRPVHVSDSGTINLPLLENVKVAGLTVTQTIEKLTRAYSDFIIQPQVFLEISEYNSRVVNVTGEVKNPGRYSLKGEVTVTEIIAQAGDLTKYASRTVRIIRETAAGDASTILELDVNRANAGDSSQNVKLQADDHVFVLTNKNIVYVSGMVKTEGYVDWEEGMTAQQAVILAGGWQEGAAPGRAKVVRFSDGKAIEIKVDLKNSKKPVPLRPGDIIKIPKSII